MLQFRFLGCLFLFFFLWQNLQAQTQLIAFQSKNKWGFLRSDGRIAIKAQFDDAFVQNNGFIWVRKKKKYGLFNPEGKQIHPCKFDDYDIIKLGQSKYTKNYCFTVLKGKKWGVMGKRGEMYLPFELDTVCDFHDTHLKSQVDFDILARAEKNDKVGFINLKGKWIIPCEYDDLEYFQEDYCIAQKNEKYGVIDRHNLPFIPFEYEELEEFGGYFMAKKGDKWGIVDRKNNTIHPFIFDSLIYSQEQYGGFGSSDDAEHNLNEKVICGYIGGEVVTYLSGQQIKGLALTSRNERAEFMTQGNYYALKMPINKEGLAIVPPGKMLLEAEYDDISLLSLNKWMVFTKDKKSGIMDSTGKIILPQEYRFINTVGDNEKAKIRLDNENGYQTLPRYVLIQKLAEEPKDKDKNAKSDKTKLILDETDEVMTPRETFYGLLDSTGKIIFPAEYAWVGKYHAIKKEGKYEVLYNRRKQIAFPSVYEKLFVITTNRIVGVKDKKIFWLDTLGKAHINPNGFTWFMPISGNRFWTYDGKRQRLVDQNGKLIFPEEYDQITPFFPFISSWGEKRNRQTNEVNYPDWWNTKPTRSLFPEFFTPVLSFSHALVRREKDKKIGLTDSVGKLLSEDFHPQDKINTHERRGTFMVKTGDNSFTFYTGTGNKYVVNDCDYASPIYPDLKGLTMEDFYRWQKTGVLPEMVRNKIDKLRDPHLFSRSDDTKPDFIAVNRHKKWAITDTSGKMLTGLEWDILGDNTLDSLIIVGRNEHWGVEGCDNYAFGFVHRKTGKLVQECKYLRGYRGGQMEGHPYFGKKLIVVRTTKGYGLLDNVGREVQPCIYDDISAFSPEALLLVKDKVAGIMDWNGKWVIDTVLDAEHAKKSTESNWLSQTFNFIRNYLNDEEVLNNIRNVKSYLIDLKKKDRYAYFDIFTNRLRSDFVYEKSYNLGYYGTTWAKKDNRYVYIDSTLTPAFDLGIDSIKSDYEERIYFQKGDNDYFYYLAARQGNKWGLIDNEGKVILPFHWENMALNNHYRYYAVAKYGGKYGVVDFKGKVILDYQYDSVGLLNRKLFMVREKVSGQDSFRWKLVNDKGKELAVTSSKDDIYAFTMHDKAVVETGDTVRLYDENGRLNDELYTDLYGSGGLAKNFSNEKFWKLPPLATSVRPVRKNKAIGMIDTLGKVVIPFQYDKVSSFNSYAYDEETQDRNHPPNEFRYWIMKKTGSFETYTQKGKAINPDTLKIKADLARKKLAVAEKYGKTGVIDANFKVVIPFIYDYIQPTKVGHWIVGKRMNENLRYGLLDSTGKEIIEVKYKDVTRVSRGGTYGSDDDFDTDDDPNLTPQSSSGHRLIEYLSPPKLYKIQDEKDKEGWADYTGKIIVSCKYDNIDRTARRDCWYIKSDKKYGWIDSSGTIKAEPIYDDFNFDKHAKEFARVEINKRHGILKYDGTMILPCAYDDIGILRNNLILVKKDSLWGMFDFQLKPVLKIEYENAEDYGCTCCPDIRFTRMRKNGKVGLSMNGQLILKCEFADISEVYANGLVEVRTEPNGKWGLVEKLTGKRMTDFAFDQVYVLEGSLEDVFVKVRIGDKYGLVSTFGQAIPCEWDEIRSVNANAVAGRKDKKWYLLDLTGKPLQAQSFDTIMGEYQSIKKRGFDED